jgi:hypothetical protein
MTSVGVEIEPPCGLRKSPEYRPNAGDFDGFGIL